MHTGRNLEIGVIINSMEFLYPLKINNYHYIEQVTMHPINFLSARLVRGTRGRQSRPAFTRGLNHFPNTLMSFTGRVRLPLTRASDASRRLNRLPRLPRLVCAVLPACIFGLLLAGCGGGGGGNGGGAPAPAASPSVSDIEFAAGGTNTSLIVSWTNPDQPSITGFNVTWQNIAVPADKGVRELTAADVNVSAGARVVETITGLMHNATYHLTIVTIYTGGRSASAVPADPARTGSAGRTPSGDLDRDGVPNADDNCPQTPNADQTNTDMHSTDGGDACDDDDDNDGVKDLADTCARNAIGWTSDATTDNDGDGCRDADEDLDDDNDGVGDGSDNCPLTANADQTNTDMHSTDGGDACDPDDDNDGFPDIANATMAADVDDNHNGLIEIRTLDDLARLRDDLNGNGADDGRFGEITSVGSTGCPAGGCQGYELTRSLNFSDAASYVMGSGGSGNRTVWTDRNGSGWMPIGSCSALDVCTAYAGVFDGGGHTIADLFIAASNTMHGVGLFGAFAGRLQNLHLRNATVRGGVGNVGLLVGHGSLVDENGRFTGRTYYENLSVTDGSVVGPSVFSERVGGLIGNGGNAKIRYAGVSGVKVFGRAFATGGLIGYGERAEIRYATVSGVDIDFSDGGNGGGLVGFGNSANIRYATVFGGSVAGTGQQNVGGLVGIGSGSVIDYAYVSDVNVSGDFAVGGLIGDGTLAQISYSYATAAVTNSKFSGGGLIELADTPPVISASYWDTQVSGLLTSAGGVGYNTTDLQSPTNFTGADNIYAAWGNAWCNPNTGAESATELPTPFVRVWDLGNSTQYPALNCLPGGLSAQGR